MGPFDVLVEVVVGVGAEDRGVDAARPDAESGEALVGEFAFDGGGGHEGAFRPVVEPAEDAVADGERQTGVAAQVLGELGVIGRGERVLAAFAVGAGRETKRAFRRDVDRVGLEVVERFAHDAPRRDGESDLRVARAREGRELLGVDHRKGVAVRLEFLPNAAERGHHAVDLRTPGVGDKGDLHAVRTFCWRRRAGGRDGAQAGSPPGFHLMLHPIEGVWFSSGVFPARTASRAARRSAPETGTSLLGRLSSSWPR